jgi:hypothetical protein
MKTTIRMVILLAISAWMASGLVAVAEGLPEAKPAAVGLSSERLARITEMLRTNIARSEIPGAVLMRFRIGVHVGDVMVVGENLLGDGVNIAARLEGGDDEHRATALHDNRMSDRQGMGFRRPLRLVLPDDDEISITRRSANPLDYVAACFKPGCVTSAFAEGRRCGASIER